MFLEKLYFLAFNNENMKSMAEEKWRVQSCETPGMTWYCFFWTSETPCTSQKFAFGYCLETRQFKYLKKKSAKLCSKNAIFQLKWRKHEICGGRKMARLEL